MEKNIKIRYEDFEGYILKLDLGDVVIYDISLKVKHEASQNKEVAL